jgi:hypothetical protein
MSSAARRKRRYQRPKWQDYSDFVRDSKRFPADFSCTWHELGKWRTRSANSKYACKTCGSGISWTKESGWMGLGKWAVRK